MPSLRMQMPKKIFAKIISRAKPVTLDIKVIPPTTDEDFKRESFSILFIWLVIYNLCIDSLQLH